MAFEQADAGEAERLAQLVEQGRQWSGAAYHAAREGGQGFGFGAGLGRFTGAPCGAVDGGADRRRHGEEHDQGQDVLAFGDGPEMDGWGEVVVEQQEPGHRRGQGRVQAADQGNHHDPGEEEQDVAGQRQVAAQPGQRVGQQGQAEGGQAEADAPPAPAQR